MSTLTNKVSVWVNHPYGYAVHILGVDGFPVLTLGVGRTPMRAIIAAQDRAADLVRDLQKLHDKEVKGLVKTV
jgi:hypothetical protein